MKQLLWKELRENLKWGLLGFLFVYFTFTYAYTQNSFYFESDVSLYFYSMMAAFLSFALGLVQIFSESTPDRWAFLMHRPVSSKQIALSKIYVGVTLIVSVWLLITLLEMYQLVSLQKLTYPMYWFRPVPALIAALIGIPAYLCGLMFVIWKPRWKVTRLLFLGPVAIYALARSYFITALSWNTLWVVVLIDLFLSAWLLATVLNVYQVTGEQSRATRFPRMATLIGTSFGVTVVMVLLSVFFASLLPRSTTLKNANIVVGSNGKLYRSVRQYDPQIMDYLITECKNINDPGDQLFQEMIAKKQLRYQYINIQPEVAPATEEAFNECSYYLSQSNFRYGKLQQTNSLLHLPGTLTVSRHEGLLLQYQSPQSWSRFVITGRIGKDGFANSYEEKPMSFGRIVTLDQVFTSIKKFDKNGKLQSSDAIRHDKCLLVCSDAIYKITPKTKTVENIYTAPQGSPIVDIRHCPDEKEPIYLIEHPNSIRVLAAKREEINKAEDNEGLDLTPTTLYLPGKEIGLIPLTPELKWKGNLLATSASYYVPKKQTLVFIQFLEPRTNRVMEANFKGEITFVKNFDQKEYRLGSFEYKTPFATKLMTVPAMPVVFWVYMGGYYITIPGGTEFIASTLREESLFVAIFFVCLVVTVIVGQWYCRSRQLTSRQTGRCFWATLLFGPAGLIAFWMIEEPPFLEPCAKCGKRMSVRSDVCPACGAARGPLPAKERNIIAEELTLPQTDSIGSRTAAEIVPS